ncbi:hypothetical protein EYF80_027289 [Liparis tanakae]|uniref:Uncharacterized protein n=1 Tax=Liparis tanakae TaxID=230148 RepID=A0A4Z2H9P1_9TELE|nr:hypothetical protein EYF80_027289 [Liparis tanakae]
MRVVDVSPVVACIGLAFVDEHCMKSADLEYPQLFIGNVARGGVHGEWELWWGLRQGLHSLREARGPARLCCRDLAEFSAECRDSISPSIIAASRHSWRSLKPFTCSGYCPNISVFSNFLPVELQSVKKEAYLLRLAGLEGVFEDFDSA